MYCLVPGKAHNHLFSEHGQINLLQMERHL